MLVPESSPEKMKGSDLFWTLLLCCFFGEKSLAMKRPRFEMGSCTGYLGNPLKKHARPR
jgi:hypothetical protein